MTASDLNRIKSIFLFLAFIVFGTSKAFATTPPPDYVELTRAEMKNRNFAFRINKYGENSSINLHFPERSFVKGSWLTPHFTYVVIKNKAGNVIARTHNRVAKNEILTIDSSYNHTLSDLSVSIAYGCPITGTSPCSGATEFMISSVSEFFDANPDAVNIPLKCRKVPDAILEILDCTE